MARKTTGLTFRIYPSNIRICVYYKKLSRYTQVRIRCCNNPDNMDLVRDMLIKEAIVCRLQEICKERQIKYNQLATQAGITPSTVYSVMNPSRKDISMITVKKLCDGLEMSIPEFFSDKIFEDLEQEME